MKSKPSISDDLKACACCGIERDVTTLDAKGRCPFCQDKEVPPKHPKIVVKPRKEPKKPKIVPPTAPAQAEEPQKGTKIPKALRPEDQAAVDEAFAIPYTPPIFDVSEAENNPQKELAMRELARRRFLPFVQRFRPKYLAGWVHRDVCRRLERFLERVENREEPRLLMMMPPRSGKQLADDTPVPTPLGWRAHGDLRDGDFVFHPSGRPVRVLAVSGKTPSDVKVTLSDGSVFYCHENHEWTLFDRKRGEWKTLEAGHFLRPSHLGTPPKLTNAGRYNYQLPPVAPLRYLGADAPMEPYVLGAWLGDGSAGKPCITGDRKDSAIITKIESLGYPVSTVCEHGTTGVLTTYFSGPRPNVRGRMTQELQGMGIYKAKRIPEIYQRLRIEARLELLAGLIDTDGTTDKNSRVTFTTVSLSLIHI